MIVLYKNLIDKYSLAVSSEHGSYPAVNLQDIRLVRIWRTDTDEDEYVLIDAGVGNTITPTCVAIANHNLTDAAVIKFQANATDDWGAPSLDETITHDADIMTKIFANSTGYRYCRFFFDDPTNPDAYIEIGRLFFGNYLQLPPISPDPEIPNATTTLVDTSRTGQPYGDEGYKYRRFGVAYPSISEAERAAILEMWYEVENSKPIFLLLWEDSLDVEKPMYGRINQQEISFKRSVQSGLLWETEIEFLEVF